MKHCLKQLRLLSMLLSTFQLLRDVDTCMVNNPRMASDDVAIHSTLDSKSLTMKLKAGTTDTGQTTTFITTRSEVQKSTNQVEAQPVLVSTQTGTKMTAPPTVTVGQTLASDDPNLRGTTEDLTLHSASITAQTQSLSSTTASASTIHNVDASVKQSTTLTSGIRQDINAFDAPTAWPIIAGNTSGAESKSDGLWSDWTPWNECSVTCGGGIHVRMRMCQPMGSSNCVGKLTELQGCNSEACPTGIWGIWQSWSECVQCKRTRTRSCNVVQSSSSKALPPQCFGDSNQEATCRNCGGDSENSLSSWSDWTKWSECSANCTRSRGRRCLQDSCTGERSELLNCFYGKCLRPQRSSVNEHQLPDARKLSKEMILLRSSNENSIIDDKHNASSLFWWRVSTNSPQNDDYRTSTPAVTDTQTGSSTTAAISVTSTTITQMVASSSQQALNLQSPTTTSKDADQGWYPWEEWRSCDCSISKRIRVRACRAGVVCQGGPSMQMKPCDDGRCGGTIPTISAIASVSSTLPLASTLPATITTTTTSASTTVSLSSSSNLNVATTSVIIGIHENSAVLRQVLRISQDNADNLIQYDSGQRNAKRFNAALDDRRKTLDIIESKKISTMLTVSSKGVTGKLYFYWSNWSTCDNRQGRQWRIAQYRRPRIVGINSERLPIDREFRDCQPESGEPINGGFSEWSQWSGCQQLCGRSVGDSSYRVRSCFNPIPVNDGKECQGATREIRPCDDNNPGCLGAVVHGGLTSWSQWSECSASCGSGTKIRTRSCQNPQPSNGGNLCEGHLDQLEQCTATVNCAFAASSVVGGWSSWTEWSECSESCGFKASRTSFRSCTNPRPSTDGPSNCIGRFLWTKPCYDLPPCPES